MQQYNQNLQTSIELQKVINAKTNQIEPNNGSLSCLQHIKNSQENVFKKIRELKIKELQQNTRKYKELVCKQKVGEELVGKAIKNITNKMEGFISDEVRQHN